MDFLQIIEPTNRFLIISSQPFDADSIGSGLVIKKYLESLGKSVHYTFPREISNAEKEYLGFLPYFDEIEFADSVKYFTEDIQHDVLILLDGADIEQFYNEKKNPGQNIEWEQFPIRIRIDHHVTQRLELGTHVFRDTEVSSTMEVILKRIISPSELDLKSATLAYAAIIGDTGNFAWNFFPSTLKLASALLEKGVDAKQLVEKLVSEITKERMELVEYVLQNSDFNTKLKAISLTITQEQEKREAWDSFKVKEIKNTFFAEVGKRIKGYNHAIFIYERADGLTSVGFRGRAGNNLDYTKTFGDLGVHGGGHPAACGYDIQGTASEVKKIVLKRLAEKLAA